MENSETEEGGLMAKQKGYSALMNMGLCGHIHKTVEAARKCECGKMEVNRVISTDNLAWSPWRGYYLPQSEYLKKVI